MAAVVSPLLEAVRACCEGQIDGARIVARLVAAGIDPLDAFECLLLVGTNEADVLAESIHHACEPVYFGKERS